MKTYKVEVTGTLNDKWYTALGSTREYARRYAMFLLEKGFDNGQRANVKSVKVVEE